MSDQLVTLISGRIAETFPDALQHDRDRLARDIICMIPDAMYVCDRCHGEDSGCTKCARMDEG